VILIHTSDQVVMDNQLLDTARDYFHFTTTFFELIEASATHIYHSALELSPTSSIVRKFYYHQRPCPLPRAVVGITDSWDPTAVSTKHSYYLSSTWSPCGKFIAAVAGEVMEIRDALTLEPLSTLRSTQVATRFRHGLAYSPDGHSLAGCSDTGIIICDTQTGGMVGKIGREAIADALELVWSLDGKRICAISQRVSGTHTVRTYEVTSGEIQSSGAVQSTNTAHLWAHGKSFLVMGTGEDGKRSTINVYEVGSTVAKVEQFPFRSKFIFGVFSPTTYRISGFVTGGSSHDDHKLLVLDVRNSGVLLQETGHNGDHRFSPDGSTFAAFVGDRLHIWRFNSGRYTWWREIRQTPMQIQFSPSLSSILGLSGPLLHVLHLDYSPAAPAMESSVTTHGRPLDAFSPYGTYIATVHPRESTITITNLHSQNPSPSQVIDTDLEVSAMVLTNNVLLVKGSDTLVAWLLTEEGVVDGIYGGRWADRSDSLWEVPFRNHARVWVKLLQQEGDDDDEVLEFAVEGELAAIRYNGSAIHVYNTRTGEVLKLIEEPRSDGYRFHAPRRDECDLYHRDLRKPHGPLECDWPISQTALQGGWVKDPEGKHRLWLHARWRSSGNDVNWLRNATTLRLRNSSELVIVKF